MPGVLCKESFPAPEGAEEVFTYILTHNEPPKTKHLHVQFSSIRILNYI